MGMILTASPGFRCRRIEAGLLSAGRDFTRDRSPFAVGLGKFIDFNKGDFIGRDYLLNASKDCLTWGMRVKNSFALVDSEISINNKKVGIVTSSTWSPFQVCGVAIVHMDKAEFGPDTIVDVRCDDGMGGVRTWQLNQPWKALYIPEMIWDEQIYIDHNAVLLVLANTAYDPSDYIEDYEEFKRLKNENK